MSELNLLAKRPASLWHNNPSLVHLLGLSPLLAVTDSLSKALALGLATFIVCLVSALSVRVFSSFIQTRWRYFWYSLILASYVSILLVLLQAFWYPLSLELGIYPALIACNFALLLRMESFQHQDKLQLLVLDATRVGLGLLLALILFAALRELLLYGRLFTDWQLLIPGNSEGAEQIRQVDEWFRFTRSQPAAFLLLGLLIAFVNWTRLWDHIPLRNESENPVQRARVTGVLKGSDKQAD